MVLGRYMGIEPGGNGSFIADDGRVCFHRRIALFGLHDLRNWWGSSLRSDTLTHTSVETRIGTPLSRRHNEYPE